MQNMHKHEIKLATVLDKGAYYIGDPCYVIPDEDWEVWLNNCNYREEMNLFGVVPHSDLVACGFSTAFGDGLYLLEKLAYSGYRSNWEVVAEIPVDAGMIGFVPVDSVPASDRPDLNHVHTFEHPVDVTWEDGNIIFWAEGTQYRIITDGSNDAELDDYWNDEE